MRDDRGLYMRMIKRKKEPGKRYQDRILWAGLCAFVVMILLKAFFVPIEEPALPAAAECWNTRKMMAAEGLAAQEAESLYRIQRVYDTDDGFPKGLMIKWAKAQGTRILVVFERWRDLNPAYDRDYLAVYDVSGRFLYGFEGVLPYMSTEIALMEDREGILFWEWKMKQTEEALFLVVNSDGEKQMYVTTDKLWPDTPAYWSSAYSVVNTKESRLVVAHSDTGERTVVFDHRDAYVERYPRSARIDEDFEQAFNALFPFVFLIVMAVFILPWMADNPNIPKRGAKEPFGDLRDRWR